jgi:hypothetical protein
MHALLYEVTEPERLQRADAWCLCAWAVFALLPWEIGRECRVAHCARSRARPLTTCDVTAQTQQNWRRGLPALRFGLTTAA